MNRPLAECNDTTNVIKNPYARKECCGIYGLRCKVNGKWYIGQSINDIGGRWDKYRRLQCKSQSKLYNALLKHGYDNFDKVIIETCEPRVEILNSRENYWMEFFDSVHNGYNVRAAGSNGKFSAAARLKMSISHIGQSRPMTETHRKNISKAKTGKKRAPFSQETRDSMKLAQQRRRLREITLKS